MELVIFANEMIDNDLKEVLNKYIKVEQIKEIKTENNENLSSFFYYITFKMIPMGLVRDLTILLKGAIGAVQYSIIDPR